MRFRKLLVICSLILLSTFFLSTTEYIYAENILQDTDSSPSNALEYDTVISSKAICLTEEVVLPRFSQTNTINSTRTISLDKYASTYGYTQLGDGSGTNTKAQIVYKLIKDSLIEFHNSSANATLRTSSISSDFYGYKEISLTSYNISATMLNQIFCSLRNDSPQFFWLSGSYYYTKNSSNINQFVFTISDEYAVAANRNTAWNKVVMGISEYLDEADKVVTTFEKEKVFHDLIIKNIDYAYDSNGLASSASKDHNVVGVFEKSGAVCEGYAKAFQMLLNVSNIENIYVTGLGSDELHAWNLVNLSDNSTLWYSVDVTWDDIGNGESGAYLNNKVYDFFNCTDSNFPDHTLDTPSNYSADYLYKVPTRTTDDSYHYYTYYNSFAKSNVLFSSETKNTFLLKAIETALTRDEYNVYICFEDNTSYTQFDQFYKYVAQNALSLASSIPSINGLYTSVTVPNPTLKYIALRFIPTTVAQKIPLVNNITISNRGILSDGSNLNTLQVSANAYYLNKQIAGTFSFGSQTFTTYGLHAVIWYFTPTDSTYSSLSGTTNIYYTPSFQGIPYVAKQTLSSLALPANWVWANPNQTITYGVVSYDVIYTYTALGTTNPQSITLSSPVTIIDNSAPLSVKKKLKNNKLTLSAIDSLSGTKYIYYKLDSSKSYKRYATKITLSVGKHKITTYAIDKAGNKSVAKTSTLTIKKPSLHKLTVYKGKVTALKINNLFTTAKTTYRSSNTSIASISSKGKITPKKTGTIKIAVTVKQANKTYKLSTTVIIKKPYIKFTKSTSRLKKGVISTFRAKGYGTTKSIVWSVSNKKLATINKTTGKLKALKNGAFYVYAKSASVSQKFKVSIK